jgi:hypothetical protein
MYIYIHDYTCIWYVPWSKVRLLYIP